MAREFNLDKESQCVVHRIADEWIDQDGIKHRKMIKEIQEEDINFGSITNPKNQDITEIEFNDTSKPKFDGFRGFFRK